MELSRVTTALKPRNLEIPGTKQRQEEVQLLHFCFAQQIKEDYAQMASAFSNSYFITLLSVGVCSHLGSEKKTSLLKYDESKNIRFKKNGLSRLDGSDENHEGLVCLFRLLAFCYHPLGLGFNLTTI